MPDFGEDEDDEEPKPLTSNDVPTKQVHLLAPIPSESKLERVETATSFVQPTEGDEGHVESWDSKLTYILATVGYAVGLGNVWRFPYLAQKNGGGAFLIPYFIMLLVEGLPIFLLELALGQRLRKGAIGAWQRISPWLGGVGIASGVVSLTVGLYYNTVIAWCLYYFGKSFQAPLPWADCPKTHFPNMTYYEDEECLKSGTTKYFWYRDTLNASPNIEMAGQFNWTIAACLLLAWLLVYVCIIKGITENPIIIYITAIYPYVVLIIFLIRALTLPGMGDGIAYLFTPQWEKLKDPMVWLDAGTQIFFSLGLAFGGLIAYSSYNPANNDCVKDAIFVAVTNCSTSLFAGIVVFAIMGFKAHKAVEFCEKRNNATLDAFNSMDPKPDIMPELETCSLQKELGTV